MLLLLLLHDNPSIDGRRQRARQRVIQLRLPLDVGRGRRQRRWMQRGVHGRQTPVGGQQTHLDAVRGDGHGGLARGGHRLGGRRLLPLPTVDAGVLVCDGHCTIGGAHNITFARLEIPPRTESVSLSLSPQ